MAHIWAVRRGNKRDLYPRPVWCGRVGGCGGNTHDFGEHATEGGNKRDFGKYATKSGNKRDFGVTQTDVTLTRRPNGLDQTAVTKLPIKKKRSPPLTELCESQALRNRHFCNSDTTISGSRKGDSSMPSHFDSFRQFSF